MSETFAWIVGLLAAVGAVVGLVFLATAATDIKDFEPDGRDDQCIVVEWKVNRVSGPDENRSGLYCEVAQ